MSFLEHGPKMGYKENTDKLFVKVRKLQKQMASQVIVAENEAYEDRETLNKVIALSEQLVESLASLLTQDLTRDEEYATGSYLSAARQYQKTIEFKLVSLDYATSKGGKA